PPRAAAADRFQGRSGDGEGAEDRGHGNRRDRDQLDRQTLRAEPAAVAGDDHQGRDDPGGEPTEESAEADVGGAEAEGEVEQEDHPDRGGDRVEATTAGDHEGGAEDAEDRSRGADRERVGTEQERPERAAEERGEVDGEEARRADRGLQQATE